MSLPFGQLSFPEIYERELVGPLFRPWAELMIDEVRPASGDRVLDIACGTGIVARLAKARVGDSGTVVGVDVSPLMLAVARGVLAGIDWREGDAGALPLRAGEQFDIVVCQQGFQFFPDKPAAVRQMRGALRPGGRLAVSIWRSDEELPILRELRRVAERHVGPIADRRHSYGDASPLEALLRDGGFQDVRSKALALTMRFADGSMWVRLNAMALVGMSAGAKEMSEAQRGDAVAAIARDSADIVRRGTDAGGFSFELRANMATARG